MSDLDREFARLMRKWLPRLKEISAAQRLLRRVRKDEQHLIAMELEQQRLGHARHRLAMIKEHLRAMQ